MREEKFWLQFPAIEFLSHASWHWRCRRLYCCKSAQS